MPTSSPPTAARERLAIQVLTPEQNERFVVWRALAWEILPWFSPTLFSLQPVDCTLVETFAVDARHRLYLNFTSIDQTGFSDLFCAEALLHECGHVFGDHAGRAVEFTVSDQERSDWNLAGDFEINDDLRDAGCRELAGYGVFASRIDEPDYRTAEHYMAKMRTLRQQARRRQPVGNPSGTDPTPDRDAPGSGDHSSQGQGTPDTPTAGCGTAAGGKAFPGQPGDGDDLGGIAPGIGEVEHERVLISTAASIRDHIAKGRGTVPGGWAERAEQILAPSKVPWRQTLRATVRSAARTRPGDRVSTYMRRRRRMPYVTVSGSATGGRVLQPGSLSPELTLAFVRDTSGSMGRGDLLAVSVEIDGIARQMGIRGTDLRVLDVDAELHVTRNYEGPRSIAEATGRGGTDMRVGVAAALELKPRPNAVVVGTDGMTPWPVEPTPVPLVAVLVGRGAERCADRVPSWVRVVLVPDTA